MHRYLLSGLMCLLLASSAPSADGALQPGETAPPINLNTLEGVPRTLDNYDLRNGTVVVFLSARSPQVAAHAQEIDEVYERYRFREILFVGIAPHPEEDAEELRSFLQHNGLRFPIYRDETGEATAHFGATAAPEFFLLDKDARVIYHGGLPYLDAAIQQLLHGGEIELPQSTLDGAPLDTPGAPREYEDPYGSMYFASQFIFEQIPGVPVHHCATIAEAANGDLLTLWYAGSYESAEDQALYLARQKNGEGVWSTPERLELDGSGWPPGNAVIFRLPDERIGIVWGRMEGSRPVRRGAGWSDCRLFMRTSEDHGHTWSEDVEIPGSYGWLPRNVPLTLANGEFVLPISGRTEQGSGSFLLVLGDDGETWEKRGFIPRGSQPTIIQRDNGELLCLMRHPRRILMSVSGDNGRTWSEPELTELKSPSSGIAMTKLDSGRVVVIFNDTDQSDRTPFNLIQSTDDGKTWRDMRTLEADWGEFSYPSIIQSSKGRAQLVYTYRRYSIKHSAFDEGWLTHLERPN